MNDDLLTEMVEVISIKQPDYVSQMKLTKTNYNYHYNNNLAVSMDLTDQDLNDLILLKLTERKNKVGYFGTHVIHFDRHGIEYEAIKLGELLSKEWQFTGVSDVKLCEPGEVIVMNRIQYYLGESLDKAKNIVRASIDDGMSIYKIEIGDQEIGLESFMELKNLDDKIHIDFLLPNSQFANAPNRVFRRIKSARS